MLPTDLLLFETDHGQVYQCGYFGRLVLTFRGFWMVFDKPAFVRFRNQVVQLAACPVGRRFLANPGLRLFESNGEKVLLLDAVEAQELVWLLDSAHFMLWENSK